MTMKNGLLMVSVCSVSCNDCSFTLRSNLLFTFNKSSILLLPVTLSLTKVLIRDSDSQQTKQRTGAKKKYFFFQFFSKNGQKVRVTNFAKNDRYHQIFFRNMSFEVFRPHLLHII